VVLIIIHGGRVEDDIDDDEPRWSLILIEHGYLGELRIPTDYLDNTTLTWTGILALANRIVPNQYQHQPSAAHS